MEPVDPILDHQQEQLRLQQSEQLRRQQLEQQRRQQQDVQLRQQREDQELLELEEDEQELLRRERATGEASQAGSAEAKSASGIAALMGLLRRNRKPVDDPESDDAAEVESESLEATSSGSGGGSGALWAVGLVLVVLAAFAVYRYGSGFFGQQKAPEVASSSTKPSVDLPLAAPEEGLSSPTGASSAPHPATSSVLGSAETTAEAAAQPSLQLAPAADSPAATPVTAHASPLTDAAAAAAVDASRVPTVAPSPELDRLAQGHAQGSESQDPMSLPVRVQLLEVQLTNLRQELSRLSEEKSPKAISTVQQVVRPTKRRLAVTAPMARSAARPAIKAASVAPADAASAPDVQARLLSVDTWDGRPSVVVASGQQTRILQPGDSINGITLKHADPVSGRATFSTGTGQVTLDVNEGNTAR